MKFSIFSIELRVTLKSKLKLNKAIFLDRDGVINKPLFKRGFGDHPFAPNKLENFLIYQSAINFVKKIKSKTDLKVYIVTNQPDLSRGNLSFKDLSRMNQKIFDNMPIDGIEYCKHLEISNCNCRKPKPGMVMKIKKKEQIDLSNSILVGDTWRDIFCGLSAGLKTYLLNKPYNQNYFYNLRINSLNDLTKKINNLQK